MNLNPSSQFLDYRGYPVTHIRHYVSEWLEDVPKGKIYVGCDSKVRGKWVKYSTVICMRKMGAGVSELYRNEVVKAPHDAYTRLWSEVSRAVAVAEELKELGPITVHVDLNSDPAYRSNKLYDASMGLIHSLGFEAAGKPHSWAASCGAHKHCK